MGTREQGFNTLKNLAGDRLVSSYADYSTVRSVLTFKCKECDIAYQSTYFLYKKSNDAKRCLNCKQHYSVFTVSSKQKFINECRAKNGEYYLYDQVPDKFKQTDKIPLVCPKHGKILVIANAHKKRGVGCAKCKIDKVTQATRSNITSFTIKANSVHNFKYNYSKSKYVNAITPMKISCNKHGEFEQTPDVHLRGSGCPVCISSVPIAQIINMLKSNNIEYVTEKTFNGCIGTDRKLRFDLFIPQYTLCVEYDGPQHFKPVKYGKNVTDDQAVKSFIKQQDHDEIKSEFCKTNNLQLIRIPYTDPHPDATLYKFLFNLNKVRYQYTWSDLNEDVKKICSYIKSFNYEKFAVYAIHRGGVPLMIPISYHFDDTCEIGIADFSRYDGKSKKVKFQLTHKTKHIPIFVVDDLISSGVTMRRVVSALKFKNKKSNIHPIVVFGEENDTNVFFIRQHPKKWIQFPYEH